MEKPMPPKDKTQTADVAASDNGAPEQNDATQQGTKLGESNAATELPPMLDASKLIGATPAVVDTSPLAKNDPKGDHRPGVIPDVAEPGIDPASNLPVDQMDGRTPLATASVSSNARSVPEDASTSGVKLRLKTDYWPKTRPKSVPEDVEYRLRAGQEISLPADEAMDLLENGHAERVKA
jgi:hypothetical protein